VLKQRSATEPLPFGKELKLLAGTVEGLRRMLASNGDAGMNSDIHSQVSAAHARFTDFDSLPPGEILRPIAACKPRSPKKKPPRL